MRETVRSVVERMTAEYDRKHVDRLCKEFISAQRDMDPDRQIRVWAEARQLGVYDEFAREILD